MPRSDDASDMLGTVAALADVDAGRVIDSRAVQAWADSLLTDRPLAAPAPG